MRIVNWNIGGGFVKSASGKYDCNDLEYILESLREYDADIIFLQEIHTPYNKKNPSQVEIIANNLGFNDFVNQPISPSHLSGSDQLSLSVISKFNIIGSEYVKISTPNLKAIGPDGCSWSLFDKGFLFAKTIINNEIVTLISGHCHPFHYFNKNSMDNDLFYVRNQVDELLSKSCFNIIAGIDFNYENLDMLIPTTMSNCLSSSFSKISTTPIGEQQDFILHSKEWNTINYEVREVDTDHYLCMADLELK